MKGDYYYYSSDRLVNACRCVKDNHRMMHPLFIVDVFYGKALKCKK
jgi:hypothetical protein